MFCINNYWPKYNQKQEKFGNIFFKLTQQWKDNVPVFVYNTEFTVLHASTNKRLEVAYILAGFTVFLHL